MSSPEKAVEAYYFLDALNELEKNLQSRINAGKTALKRGDNIG